MKIRYKYSCGWRWMILCMAMLCGITGINAQELLNGKAETAAVAAISSNYKPWRSAGWTSRLKSDMLPASVTVKTYMIRDSLTLVSLRVPLFGEVARVEIDRNSVIAVNKMKKRYASIDLRNYADIAPGLHSNIQDVLIGRVTIIGDGTLSKTNCHSAAIFQIEPDLWLVSAILNFFEQNVNYGYATDKTGRILEMMVTQGKPYSADTPEGMKSEAERIDTNVSVEVAYGKSAADAKVSILMGGRTIQASLEGVELQWGISGFDRLNLSRGYTRCPLKDVIRF